LRFAGRFGWKYFWKGIRKGKVVLENGWKLEMSGCKNWNLNARELFEGSVLEMKLDLYFL
jgi:nitrogen fixation protein